MSAIKKIGEYTIIKQQGNKYYVQKNKQTFTLKSFPLSSSKQPGKQKQSKYQKILKHCQKYLQLTHQHLQTIHSIFMNPNQYTINIVCQPNNKKQSIDLSSLTPQNTKQLMIDIASAVSYLHSQSIIHNRISLRNIQQEKNIYKLLFQTIREIQGARVREQIIEEELDNNYTSPEKHERLLCGSQVDVWALGVVFIEMITKSKIDMLCSTLPFQIEDFPDEQILERLPNCRVRCLIKLMLEKSVGKRANMKKVLDLLKNINLKKTDNYFEQQIKQKYQFVSYSLPIFSMQPQYMGKERQISIQQLYNSKNEVVRYKLQNITLYFQFSNNTMRIFIQNNKVNKSKTAVQTNIYTYQFLPSSIKQNFTTLRQFYTQISHCPNENIKLQSNGDIQFSIIKSRIQQLTHIQQQSEQSMSKDDSQINFDQTISYTINNNYIPLPAQMVRPQQPVQPVLKLKKIKEETIETRVQLYQREIEQLLNKQLTMTDFQDDFYLKDIIKEDQIYSILTTNELVNLIQNYQMGCDFKKQINLRMKLLNIMKHLRCDNTLPFANSCQRQSSAYILINQYQPAIYFLEKALKIVMTVGCMHQKKYLQQTIYLKLIECLQKLQTSVFVKHLLRFNELLTAHGESSIRILHQINKRFYNINLCGVKKQELPNLKYIKMFTQKLVTTINNQNQKIICHNNLLLLAYNCPNQTQQIILSLYKSQIIWIISSQQTMKIKAEKINQYLYIIQSGFYHFQHSFQKFFNQIKKWMAHNYPHYLKELSQTTLNYYCYQ